MRNDMEMLLHTRFRGLFEEFSGGIGCWEGWYDLIWECSKELERLNTYVRYLRIKEKFGGLHLYILDDYESNCERGSINQAVIQKYHVLSMRTCEGCGSTHAVDIRSSNTWVKTLCLRCDKLWQKDGFKPFAHDYHEDLYLDNLRHKEHKNNE